MKGVNCECRVNRINISVMNTERVKMKKKQRNGKARRVVGKRKSTKIQAEQPTKITKMIRRLETTKI